MILKTDWKFYLSGWLVGLVAKLTPWTAACLAPLFMEFSRQDLLEWVVISFSRGPSRLEANPGLLHCRQILYQLAKCLYLK